MKIVDVAEFYAEKGGGVRTYINQKLEHGRASGHEIVIIAPGPEDREESRLGGKIVWIGGPPLPPDPRYYVLWRERAVHDILFDEAPDVVEGSSPWTGGWFAARWRGPAVKTFIFHQDPVAVYPQTLLGGVLGRDRVDALFGLYWGYLRRLSRHYDATIVSGHWLAERLDGFGLRRPEAVPFGIEKSLFSPNKRDLDLRRELLARCGCSDQGRLLVNVSRFHPEKRLGTVLEAARRVGENADVGLVIYGDGPLRSWVRRRADKLDNVHLAGFTKDRDALARVLASADVMVHGSAAETYGLVVAEALCSGLPVVVPDVGGAGDLAGPGYAETYPAGDAAACATAIERVLARPWDDLSDQAKGAGRETIGTMGDHFQALFSLYARLVEERLGVAP